MTIKDFAKLYCEKYRKNQMPMAAHVENFLQYVQMQGYCTCVLPKFNRKNLIIEALNTRYEHIKKVD